MRAHWSTWPPYLQDHALLRFRNFATMATWRNDISPPYSLLFLTCAVDLILWVPVSLKALACINWDFSHAWVAGINRASGTRVSIPNEILVRRWWAFCKTKHKGEQALELQATEVYQSFYVIIISCYRTSEPGAKEQGIRANPHKDKNCRFLPTMHLFLLTTKQRIFTTIPTPITFIHRTPLAFSVSWSSSLRLVEILDLISLWDEFLFYIMLS